MGLSWPRRRPERGDQGGLDLPVLKAQATIVHVPAQVAENEASVWCKTAVKNFQPLNACCGGWPSACLRLISQPLGLQRSHRPATPMFESRLFSDEYRYGRRLRVHAGTLGIFLVPLTWRPARYAIGQEHSGLCFGRVDGTAPCQAQENCLVQDSEDHLSEKTNSV